MHDPHHLQNEALCHLYGWSHQGDVDRGVEGSSAASPSAETEIRLSIVIPTLNQAETIEDTLLSILGQNYSNLEIIVMDGASTDATLAVLEPYKPWITHLVSRNDGGQSQAINQGFRLATGEVFAWINSDDYYLPGTFHKVVKRFHTDPHIQFAVGAGDVISKTHDFLRHVPALPMDLETMLNWRHDRWVMQQSCFWTRSLWQEAEGVDESLHLLMDYDLWFRFSKLTEADVIEDTLAVMRYYPEVKTVRQKGRFSEEMAYVLAKNGAYNDVRSLVADLAKQKLEAQDHLSRFQDRWAVRLSKRLGLLPR
jgi:glycosyltransferase involved in cell wall biosynthesis